MGRGFRKMRKRAKAIIGKPHQGPCFKKGCQLNGSILHECLTCEKLELEAAASRGNEDEVGDLDRSKLFTIQACVVHSDEGLKKVRRHALTAHPANLLRVVAAGLKGEQI